MRGRRATEGNRGGKLAVLHVVAVELAAGGRGVGAEQRHEQPVTDLKFGVRALTQEDVSRVACGTPDGRVLEIDRSFTIWFE